MDLIALQQLVATVDHGSITAAAHELGLTRPTLSRRLAALEDDLGLVLLHRTTRAVTPTPAGRRLVDEAGPLLDALRDVERSLHQERDEVVGCLRVSVPPVIAGDVARLLVDLRRTHPHLQVELRTGTQHADLQADGIEVALRAGAPGPPDLVLRRLRSVDVHAVAAPATLTRDGVPETPHDLRHHTLLRGLTAQGQPRTHWPLRDGGSLPVDGPVVMDDQRALLEAALAGGGVALLSQVTAGSALERGALQPVLPGVIGTHLDLHVVFAHRDRQPARVRAFIDAVVDAFG